MTGTVEAAGEVAETGTAGVGCVGVPTMPPVVGASCLRGVVGAHAVPVAAAGVVTTAGLVDGVVVTEGATGLFPIGLGMSISLRSM
jgi:hypothetical protein